jgi:hypothetical protein
MHAKKPVKLKIENLLTDKLESMASLDEPVSGRFYYKATDSSECYSIALNSISLIPLFKSTVDLTKCADQYASEENAYVVSKLHFNSEFKDVPDFIITNAHLFKYIDRYVKIWESDPANANYGKEGPVTTGNPEQVLQPADVSLINDYLAEQKIITDGLKQKYDVLKTLEPLIDLADEYLQMEGFATKLYMYNGTILWNCSLKDLHEATGDPFFQKLQEQAMEYWKQQNADKLDSATRPTVGAAEPAEDEPDD